MSDEEELLDEETKKNIVEGELRPDGTRGPRRIRRYRRRPRPVANTDDAQSTTADYAAAAAEKLKADLAQEILRSSTGHMRTVHSKASAAALVEHAERVSSSIKVHIHEFS